MQKTGSILLSDYDLEVAPTDVIDPTDINPVLHGLFGEVGGIMAAAKKHVREKTAYPGFRRAAEEEFGDTLWYLAAICRRVQIPLDAIFTQAAHEEHFKNVGAASDFAEGALSYIALPTSASNSIDATLIVLGKSAAALLEGNLSRTRLVAFAKAYLDAIHASRLVFSEVARTNIRKVRGAFLEPPAADLAFLDFDHGFGPEEQLPREFKIRVNQRGSGKSYLQWNGVFIGDPLMDNIADRDGYRFHDVFHFSNAAILHWSPVIRALIKHKRKSKPGYDEEQDSGRAIVVEEGLTAWIFTRAKELNFFDDQEKVSLGILKTIGEFVTGYEVERCPLKLWERAIIDGFSVFRQLKANEGGWIIGNRALRTIKYMPLESAE